MPRVNPGPPCTVCGKPSLAKLLCETHYRRLRKTGTTSPSSYGTHCNHPLYGVWAWTPRVPTGRVERWESFENFLLDVGDLHPGSEYSFKRVDRNKPFGPTNFHWVKALDITVKSKDSINEYAKQLRKLKPDGFRETEFKKRYKTSLAVYNEHSAKQNNLCAICNRPETLVIKGIKCNLALDHCHKTSKIRGLLCSKCNRGLGYFQDNPIYLKNAANYLTKEG